MIILDNLQNKENTFYTQEPIKTVNSKKNIFNLTVTSISTEESKRRIILTAISNTVNDWQTIIKNRFINTQKTNPSWGNSDSLETDDNLIEDSVIIQKYHYLKEKIEHDISAIKVKSKNNYYLMILTDSEQRIQGVASVRIKTNLLFVNVLMTAPWNVPLYSANAPEHKDLVVKGVGTTLMRQIYELAKINKKPTIELNPVPSSLSFYVDHLKMTLSQRRDKVSYVVSEDQIPKALEVESGNLLPTTL